MSLSPLIPTPPAAWRSYAGLYLRPRAGLLREPRLPAIGRSTGPVKLNAHWLAAYRDLVGLPRDPAALLPPLALQLAASPLHLEILADRKFPFKASGLVHLGLRIDQAGPIDADAVLQLESATGRSNPCRHGILFDLVTEARRDGRLAWRSITTMLARGARPSSAPATESRGSSLSEYQTEWPDTGQGWRRVGLIEAPAGLGRRYAKVARDWNPLHRRDWLSRRFGLEKAVIHGSWTLARALASATWPLHDAFSMQARFFKPVPLPAQMGVWTYTGMAIQGLRVTDTEGLRQHLVARVEPALTRDA
jgi:acyl dehydratase